MWSASATITVRISEERLWSLAGEPQRRAFFSIACDVEQSVLVLLLQGKVWEGRCKSLCHQLVRLFKGVRVGEARFYFISERPLSCTRWHLIEWKLGSVVP